MQLRLQWRSKYGTVLSHITRKAVIHTTLFVASSGLTRANRVQDCPPYLGAELDAAPAFECQRAAWKKRRFFPISNFRLDARHGGGMKAAVDVRMSPSSNAVLWNSWALSQSVYPVHAPAAPTNAPPPTR